MYESLQLKGSYNHLFGIYIFLSQANLCFRVRGILFPLPYFFYFLSERNEVTTLAAYLAAIHYIYLFSRERR